MIDRLRKARVAQRESDGGFAMISVVLISVVIFTAMLIAAATTLVGVTTTASAKDSLKVVNAAEGGRDELLASLSNNFRGCQPTGNVEKNGLTYSYKVFSYTVAEGATPPRRPSEGQEPNCPSDANTHILLNVTGKTGGDATKTINNTYALLPGSVSAPAPVYFGGVEGAGIVGENNITITGSTLLSPGDTPGTVNFPTGLDVFSNKGSISCTNTTGSGVTIFSILGNVTANNCSVAESRFDGTTIAISNHTAEGESLIARARGALSVTNSVISGFAGTAQTNISLTGSTVDGAFLANQDLLSTTSSFSGSVGQAGRDVNISGGTQDNSSVAANRNMLLRNSARSISNTLCYSGTYTINTSATRTGGILTKKTKCTSSLPRAAQVAPDSLWVNHNPLLSGATDVVKLTDSKYCLNTGNSLVDFVSQQTKDVVIDLMSCAKVNYSPPTPSSPNTVLKNNVDVTLVGRAIDMQRTKVVAGGENSTFNVVVPSANGSTVAPLSGTCSSTNGAINVSGFGFVDNAGNPGVGRGNIYTPCALLVTGSTVKGQFFAGTGTFQSSTVIQAQTPVQNPPGQGPSTAVPPPANRLVPMAVASSE